MEAFKSFKYAQAPHFLKRWKECGEKREQVWEEKSLCIIRCGDEEQGEAKMAPNLESWDHLLRELRQFAGGTGHIICNDCSTQLAPTVACPFYSYPFDCLPY